MNTAPNHHDHDQAHAKLIGPHHPASQHIDAAHRPPHHAITLQLQEAVETLDQESGGLMGIGDSRSLGKFEPKQEKPKQKMNDMRTIH